MFPGMSFNQALLFTGLLEISAFLFILALVVAVKDKARRKIDVVVWLFLGSLTSLVMAYVCSQSGLLFQGGIKYNWSFLPGLKAANVWFKHWYQNGNSASIGAIGLAACVATCLAGLLAYRIAKR